MSFVVDSKTVLATDASELSSSNGLMEKTGQWTLTQGNTPAVVTGPRSTLFARRLNGTNTHFTATVTTSSSANATRDVFQSDCVMETCVKSRSHATAPSTRRTLFLIGYNDAALVWLVFSPSGGFEVLYTPSLGGVMSVHALPGPTLTEDVWTYIALRKVVTSGTTASNRLNTYELYVRPLNVPFGADAPDASKTAAAQSGLQATVHFDIGENVGGPSANAPSYFGLHDQGPIRFSSGARSLGELQESFARLGAVTIPIPVLATPENRWLATNIVRSLKLRGLVPTADTSFTLDDFFFLLDEGLRNYVVPILRESNQEDYLTRHEDLPVVSGTARYPIPQRAASEQLVLVQLQASDGTYRRYGLTTREDASCVPTGCYGAWYIDDDAIVVVPTPVASSSLRVHYVARPGRVVDESACGKITAFDANARTVTLAATPADVTGSGTTASSVGFSTALTFDVVRGRPGFRCLAVDMVCTGLASNVMTFSSALPSDIAVGDYACIAGESPIAQVPEGAHPLLAAWATYTCEMSFGNSERATMARAEMERQEKFVRSLISQQKGNTPSPVINLTSPGWSRIRRRLR